MKGTVTMKKTGCSIGLLVIALMLLKIILIAKDKKAASTNIIGSADGQTIIFLKQNQKELNRQGN